MSRRYAYRDQQQVHDVLGRRARDVRREPRDAALEAVHDGFSLPRDADARQILRLGLGLGGLDHQDLVALGLLGRRLLQALRRVDLVHRRADARVRRHVRDQRVHDEVAEAVHRRGQRLLDGDGDLFLRLEGPVQRVPRQRRAHDVVHVGRDLAPRVRELVERLAHLLLEHVVLDRDDDLDEHVVQGLRLAPDLELLHLERERAGDLVHGPQHEVHARAQRVAEAAPPFHDGGVALLDALDAGAAGHC